ncbi:MAG: PilZ domain-containing protein [Nitrospirota bacterium]|nr:PilZ domain-containing protein [Nitrospirota bacterium]
MGRVFFKREFDRTPVELWVVVTTRDGHRIDGMTGDIGMGGCCLSSVNPPALGARCRVQMRFGEGEHAVDIETPGTVVWVRDALVGIAFENMDEANRRRMHDLFLYNPEGTE